MVRNMLGLCLGLLLCCGALYAKDNILTEVKVMPLPDNRVRFDFQFTDPIAQQPASFITKDPARLVVDFVNSTSRLDDATKAQKMKLGSLVQYKIVALGNRIRAILDLSATVTYTGEISGRVYTLILTSQGEQLLSPIQNVFITHRPVNAHFSITNLNFQGIDKRGGRLVLDVTDTGIPIDMVRRGEKVIINLTSTRIPPHLLKRYDVVDFHSPTQWVTLEQNGKTARVILANKGDYSHFAYQVNKQFIVDIYPLTADEIQDAKLKKKLFLGKHISLNFQSIQVRAVLQLLADFTGINIVVSNEVGGNITLRLNDVPWDQALDIILTTQGLDKRQLGNVILVDKAAAFTARETDLLKQQLAAKKLAPLQSELIQINYAKAADIATMLKDKTNSLLSERGSISVDSRTNTIWLKDTESQIEVVRDLVQKLDIPVRQVMIEARIVDISKQCEEDIGIRWGITQASHLSGTLRGANQMQGVGTYPANQPGMITPFTDRLNVDLAASPTIGTATSVGLALAKLGDGVLLDLELSALESVGKAEVIASPRLMTTDRQSASISSGEDIPYQQSTSSGATAVSFKEAVLSLKVTPQITPDGKLLMDLLINQDANSGETVLGVPIITTKSIQTNVLVNNGQTIVLGGVYQQNKNVTSQRIPFFGGLPYVGHLFGKTQTKSSNDELLIFITPRIITNNLSLTAIEGGPQNMPKGVELDKFGKPVVIPPQFQGYK